MTSIKNRVEAILPDIKKKFDYLFNDDKEIKLKKELNCRTIYSFTVKDVFCGNLFWLIGKTNVQFTFSELDNDIALDVDIKNKHTAYGISVLYRIVSEKPFKIIKLD